MTRRVLFFPEKGHLPFFFRGIERDAADGDAKIAFDLLFDRRVFSPMAQGKAAVDLRIFGVFRGEIRVELFFGIDFFDMAVSEFLRSLEKIDLDIFELAKNC